MINDDESPLERYPTAGCLVVLAVLGVVIGLPVLMAVLYMLLAACQA